MEKNELDKRIEQGIRKEIEKPDKYKEIIKNALENEKYNSYYKFKKVACLLILIFCVSTVFGKEIFAFINSIMKKYSNTGIQEAIDNGYIQYSNKDKTKENGIVVSIKEILMDDYNLSILFDLYSPSINNTSKYDKIILSNLLIEDEENNVIIANLEGTEKYKEFYKEKNITNMNKNISYADSINGKVLTNYDKNIEYMLIASSENFPKSKKLSISFDKIIYISNKSNEEKIVEGDWKLTIDLSDKIYNRETLVYNVKSCSKQDIIVTMANVSNTAMKLRFTTKWGNPVYSENDSEEDKNKKIKEFFDNTHSVDSILIKGEYVENSNGEKFYPLQSSDGDGGYNQMFNGMLNYWQTFDLTKYNATETLKVVMQTKEGEEIIIELENK